MAKLPFVFLNLAITADGKIAPSSRRFKRFTHARDHELMMEIRTGADAVMCGARTVDSAAVDLGPGGRKYQQQRLRKGLSEYNLRVVVSGSASLNPTAYVFRKRFSPILLITSESAPKRNVRALANKVDDVFRSPGAGIDFREALMWLAEKWNVRSLLCEGGGELNAALFRAGLVQELYLTIAPIILGGRTAPTLADGSGISHLLEAVQLKAKKLRLAGGEMYCIYQVVRP